MYEIRPAATQIRVSSVYMRTFDHRSRTQAYLARLLPSSRRHLTLPVASSTTAENYMRKTLAVIGTSLGLLLSYPVLSFAESPDAVIELSGGSVAAGVGWNWGTARLSSTASAIRLPSPASLW